MSLTFNNISINAAGDRLRLDFNVGSPPLDIVQLAQGVNSVFTIKADGRAIAYASGACIDGIGPQHEYDPAYPSRVALVLTGRIYAGEAVTVSSSGAATYIMDMSEEPLPAFSAGSATNLSELGDGPSYLGSVEADALAAECPASMLTAYLAATTTAAKGAALRQATLDVDASMRFQGRRYDASQVREFPRVPYEVASGQLPVGPYLVGADTAAAEIWDWDDDTDAAVVPSQVKLAVLYQANRILRGVGQAAQDQADGIASKSLGTASVSYRPGAGNVRLAAEAMDLLERYRLRSGQML
jgi:hypothetical protein